MSSPQEPIQQYHLNRHQPGRLQLAMHTLAPYLARAGQKAMQPHRHSYYQIIWFQQPGQHFIDFQAFEHPAHSFFLVNKDQVHYFCPNSPNQGLLLHFNEDFVAHHTQGFDALFYFLLFYHGTAPFLSPPPETQAKWEALLHQMHEEYALPTASQPQALFHWLQLLLIHLKRHKDATATPQSTQHNNGWGLYFQLMQYLQAHLGEALTVEGIGQALNVPPKRLTATTKALVHKTPGELIAERKILEAKRLLSAKGHSIKEVAFALGFDQATYFTKYFKKHTGHTPKAFAASLP